MPLLTALIVKNSHILPGIYFIFYKKASNTQLERPQRKNLEYSEKSEKQVSRQILELFC